MEVFSHPVCPNPMEYGSVSPAALTPATGLQGPASPGFDPDFKEFEEQFFSEIPGFPLSRLREDEQQCALPPSTFQSMTCLQQPPEQPLLDSFPFEQDESNQSSPLSSSYVVKQEQQSGFLAAWSNQLPEDFNAMEIDQCPPEVRKQVHSSLVKTELNCKIKLKLMQEGREIITEVTDNQQPSAKDYEVSEETRAMQRMRKEKNREAAKKCRQKKKASERDQEMKIRAHEAEIQRLKKELEKERRDYKDLMERFPNVPCFLAYLKHNRHLMRDPVKRAVMQGFVKKRGGMAQPHGSCLVCWTTQQQQQQPQPQPQPQPSQMMGFIEM